MGQITIYVPPELEAKINHAAKSAHLSKSKWVSAAISRSLANEWSEHVKKAAGSWDDFPSVEEIRSGQSEDVERESM